MEVGRYVFQFFLLFFFTQACGLRMTSTKKHLLVREHARRIIRYDV